MFYGIVLALSTALAESLVDVLRKKSGSAFDPLIASWMLSTVTFVAGLILTGAFDPTPFPVTTDFWAPLIATTLLNSVAMYLYMSVLATGELSLVLPLVTLSPVFLLFTAPLINGEYPSWIGILGVIITTLGTYGLKFEDRAQGFWKPITNLLAERRNQKMLLVAFIWAWSSALDKEASLASSPFWFLTLMDGGLMLIYLPFMFHAKRWAIIGKDQAWVRLLPLGLMNTLRAWCQFTSVTLILVPYAIGLKRLSIFFGLLWAYWIFKEKTPRSRVIAAIVMLVGSVLILLASFNSGQ